MRVQPLYASLAERRAQPGVDRGRHVLKHPGSRGLAPDRPDRRIRLIEQTLKILHDRDQAGWLGYRKWEHGFAFSLPRVHEKSRENKRRNRLGGAANEFVAVERGGDQLRMGIRRR